MSSWIDLVNLVILVSVAVVGFVQLQLTIRSNRELRTLELDGDLDEIAAARDRLEREFKRGSFSGSLPLDLTRKVLDGNADLELDLRRVLARYEMFCMPICARISDEDVSFELSGSSVVWYGQAFREYILDLRQNLDAPALYIYLTFMAERWGPRKNSNLALIASTGQPHFVRRNKRLRSSRP